MSILFFFQKKKMSNHITDCFSFSSLKNNNHLTHVVNENQNSRRSRRYPLLFHGVWHRCERCRERVRDFGRLWRRDYQDGDFARGGVRVHGGVVYGFSRDRGDP